MSETNETNPKGLKTPISYYVAKHGWKQQSFDKMLSSGNGAKMKTRGRKIEVLTMNY